jgi:hypothetical protein
MFKSLLPRIRRRYRPQPFAQSGWARDFPRQPAEHARHKRRGRRTRRRPLSLCCDQDHTVTEMDLLRQMFLVRLMSLLLTPLANKRAQSRRWDTIEIGFFGKSQKLQNRKYEARNI